MRKDFKTIQAELTDLNWDGNIEESLPNICYDDKTHEMITYKIFVIKRWLDACAKNRANGEWRSSLTLKEYSIIFDEWLKETWRMNNGS